MNSIFCDTSFIIAFYNKKDDNHHRARRFISEEVAHYFPFIFIITDYIYDEILTLIRIRIPSKAIQIARKILADETIRLEFVGEHLFHNACEIYREFDDKKWSFTDCSSLAFMEEKKIKFCVSFDRHYSQFGVVTNIVDHTQ